jgi:hypothetical protein
VISRRRFLAQLLSATSGLALAACAAQPAAPAAPPAAGSAAPDPTDTPRATAPAPAPGDDIPLPEGPPPPWPTATTLYRELPTATPLPPVSYPFRIVRREEWGALPPDHSAIGEPGFFDPVNSPFGWLVYDRPLRSLLDELIVHHSARPPDSGPYEIQQLHRSAPRFAADIAYHFLIGADGALYEGRDIRVRGRHTQNANYGTIGICLLGNFELHLPPPAQLKALDFLIDYLVVTYASHYLSSHRDFWGGTVCPGERLHRGLGALAQRHGLAYSTAGYVPPEWLATLTPGPR